jgi:hypothetical protein
MRRAAAKKREGIVAMEETRDARLNEPARSRAQGSVSRKPPGGQASGTGLLGF